MYPKGILYFSTTLYNEHKFLKIITKTWARLGRWPPLAKIHLQEYWTTIWANLCLTGAYWFRQRKW